LFGLFFCTGFETTGMVLEVFEDWHRAISPNSATTFLGWAAALKQKRSTGGVLTIT